MSDISYLIIYNAHNGNSIKIPKPIRSHDLKEFKRFLSQSFLFENVDNIFLLTSFGIKLNFNLINELIDIYVFDKRLFANSVDARLLNNYTDANDGNITSHPQVSILSTMSDTDSKNIQQITNSLKQNQGWAQQLLRHCLNLGQYSKDLIYQINVIFKSLNTMFQFATNFINDVEKDFNKYFNYIKLTHMKTLHKSWNEHYNKLSKFPHIKIKNKSISLIELLNHDQLLSRSKYIEQYLPLVINEFNSMRQTMNVIGEEKLNVDKQIESLRNQSINEFKDVNLSNITQAIKATVQLVINDYDKLSTSDTDLFEIYNLHKNNYCPKVYKDSVDLFNHYNALKEFKRKLINESLRVFNKIANLQMNLVPVKQNLSVLTKASPSTSETSRPTTNTNSKQSKLSYETIQTIKKYEDYLALTIDLPLLFGFILIEKRRQYEWYDHFTRGVVTNVSEQVTTIIDHEKLFRKLWMKRFASVLPLLNANPEVSNSNLPNFDITLIGNNRSNSSLSFKILDDVIIGREDIENYISILQTSPVSKNSIELLNKNLNDLKDSTKAMKTIIKVVTSIGKYTSLAEEREGQKQKLKQGQDQEQGQELELEVEQQQEEEEEEVDIDLNLVEGLKSRIKKLENLLHQQQYKNLTSWPVTRNNHINGLNSAVVVAPTTDNGQAHNSVSINNRSSLMLDPNTVFKSDPTQLLSRRNSINSRAPVALTESTNNIDRHLDNIRLKRENQELMGDNERLMEENQSQKDEIERLKKQITALNEENQEKDNEITLNTKLNMKEVDNLNKKVDQRDTQVSDLQNNIMKLTELNSNMGSEVNKLNQTIYDLRKEVNESTQVKNDLLFNLTTKESEITKQKATSEEEIKQLQSKVKDMRLEYDNAIELRSTDRATTQALEIIIIKLFDSINRLSHELFESFLEFCFILESMGLLLSKDENNVYKIIRVKGLRSKKNVGGDEADTSLISIEKPSSRVIDDIGNKMVWLDELKDLTLVESSDNDGVINQANNLIKLFNDNLKSENSKLDDYLSLISFKENVQMQEGSINNTKFFLNAIAKRFKDVEGFAKRQTKDNKAKDQEISKLRLSKISMNGFQVNDLVLFLPTRIEKANNEIENGESQQQQQLQQPWAAFNIGAPHYFLKVTDENLIKDKEWMVAKVLSVTEHKVEESNVSSKELNPFQLSVGVVWHLIEAKEHFA